MGKKSVQLVRLNAKPTTEGKGTKGHRVVLDYTRLDSDSPSKPTKSAKFIGNLTAAEIELLKGLKEGSEVSITKEEGKPYTTSDGRTLTSWNIVEINKADGFKAKPKIEKKPFVAKSSGYDNLGQQIGNCITNAVNSIGPGATVEEYKQRALEFIKAGDALRAILSGDEKAEIEHVATTNNNKPSFKEANQEAKFHTLDDILDEPNLHTENVGHIEDDEFDSLDF